MDHLVKIRGVLFTPVAVEELLRAEFPEIGEYEILVQRQGTMDEISIKYELQKQMSDLTHDKLHKRLSDRLKVKTNLRFHLLCVKPGELPRYSLKAKRFKDQR